MSTWKMQSVQSRLRGGGAGHAMMAGVGQGGGGMMMGGGMQIPMLRQHYSLQ